MATALAAATIAAASPAMAQSQDTSAPSLAPITLQATDSAPVAASRLIIRRDTDGGAPVFDTVAAGLSGIMRIATDPTITGVELDGTSQLMWQPTDPSYAQQWEDQLTGMETAWDVTRGDPGIVIAVVDSGVTPGPEFGARLLTGQSFIGTDPAVDPLGHGTSAAAVAAAEANNGIAGAGVCSACTILPVQVADSAGQVPWSAAANGIIWAADQGADIINLSFGSRSPSDALRDAISYAASLGVVVVASAGNYGDDLPVYPANYPAVVSVAGHDQAFNRKSWSSYGPWVDLAAPGCVLGLSSGASTPVCGTSFASPWIAGAAALLLSAQGPLMPAQVEVALEDTTIANDWVRTGRVDASLLLLPGTASLDPVQPRISAGDVNLTGRYTGNVTQVDLVVDGTIAASDPNPTAGRFQLMWAATAAPSGDHLLQVEAINASGTATVGDSVSVQVIQGSGFNDVVRDSYYDIAVTWMVFNSITSGTTPTTYEPDSPVTRAQIATFLWRYSDRPTAQTPSHFEDTAVDSWYTPAVDWMVETHITSGTTPATYEPDRPVTRAQVATFLWRLAGSPAPTGPGSFADVDSGRWYTAAVDWMVEAGYTTGTSAGTYSPDSLVTRAQLATFLWRFAGRPTP